MWKREQMGNRLRTAWIPCVNKKYNMERDSLDFLRDLRSLGIYEFINSFFLSNSSREMNHMQLCDGATAAAVWVERGLLVNNQITTNLHGAVEAGSG